MKQYLLLLIGLLICPLLINAQKTSTYVTVQGRHFYLGEKEYRYVGTNCWYAALLGSTGEGGDHKRLVKELDAMQRVGINNVRVLAGGDGTGERPDQIKPTLQTAPGVYNEKVLEGLDFLLAELEKRDMRAILYLNNAWEWSGGFGQYLEWIGQGDANESSEWDWYQQYHSEFVRNDSAKAMASRHTQLIVSRTNSITHRPYSESPAIMAWEIANEPRAFAQDSLTEAAFAEWIHSQAKLIKSIDKNHLVTTGSEGYFGCECSLDLFERIHAFPEVDYACIHIWPFNWNWLGKHTTTVADAIRENGASSVIDSVDAACRHTAEYIGWHRESMQYLNKPLVLEEFGYPRDGYTLKAGTPTQGRDAYYRYVFSLIKGSGDIAGCNFWGWGGLARSPHANWQPWDPYTADPAQEEQGLNSVFSTDKSTLKAIRQMVKEIAE